MITRLCLTQYFRDLVAKRHRTLYPVEVLEHEAGKVKIHYIGYGSSDDEWKEEEELVDLSEPTYLLSNIFFAPRASLGYQV